MTIKEDRDAWGQYDISRLFVPRSFRLELVGEYDLHEEDGNTFALLKRDEDGNLLQYSLKFQKPKFDGKQSTITAAIQYEDNGEWKESILNIRGSPISEVRVTNSQWNVDHRRDEAERELNNHKLDLYENKSCRIVLIPVAKEGDMPAKGKNHKYQSEKTLLYHVDSETKTRTKLTHFFIPQKETSDHNDGEE